MASGRAHPPSGRSWAGVRACAPSPPRSGRRPRGWGSAFLSSLLLLAGTAVPLLQARVHAGEGVGWGRSG